MTHTIPSSADSRSRAQPLALADIPDAVWHCARDIRFSDCDATGIVYTPRFIDLSNGVIEEFFAARLGIDYHHLIQIDRIGLGYASVDTDFFAPASMGDCLRFSVLVEHIGRSSVIYTVHAHCGDTPILRCRLVMVTTIAHQPIAVPPALRLALETYLNSCR